VIDVPSPNDQTAETGIAVAVTETPAAVAVADRGDQDDAPAHTHIGTPISSGLPGTGLDPITGLASWSSAAACAANCPGVGADAGGGFVSHTSVLVEVKAVPLELSASTQDIVYHAPFCPAWVSVPAEGT
jgi:hypothetical protein